MSNPSSSEQDTPNALSLSRAIYGPCTDLFRELLKSEIPVDTFLTEFNNRKVLLPRKMKLKKLVSKTEEVFDGSYENFDLSLLYFLLRNITKIPPPLSGWGKTPDKADTSSSAHIERIIKIRNICSHPGKVSMSDENVNEYWEELEDSIQSLELNISGAYNPKYSKGLKLIRNGPLNDSTQKQSKVIKDEYVEENETGQPEEDEVMRNIQNSRKQQVSLDKKYMHLIISIMVVTVVTLVLYDEYHNGWKRNTTQPDSRTFPGIVTRVDWGARPPKRKLSQFTEEPYIVVIIHGATNPCNAHEECIKSTQAYQNFHMDTRGWDDIGYNFLIGEDGYVYEGRGSNNIGAHTLGYNAQSIGICFIGNFNYRLPNPKALGVAKELIQWLVESGNISENYTLKGHRDLRPTESPGHLLYSEIQNWPHS